MKTHRTGRLVAGLFAIVGGGFVGVSPALAEPLSTTPPVVQSFQVTPTVLPATGGTVTLSARTKGASTCTLSVQAPNKVTGLPATSACTSQLFSKKVTLGKNPTGNVDTYTFSFTAKNTGGTSPASTATVNVGGSPPPISFSPAALSFSGTTAVGLPTPPLTITIKNNSTTSSQLIQNLGATGIDASDFFPSQAHPGGCGVEVSPGATCTINVVFGPTGIGKRTAKVEIEDETWGAAGTTVLYNVYGTGAFASASLSLPSINWAQVGTEPDQGEFVATVPVTETLTNTSPSVQLAIGAFPSLGSGGNFSDFSIVTGSDECQNVTVDPGKSCTFQVEFDPQGTGTRSSTIVIPDNTANGDTAIAVSGTGAYATATFTSGGKPVTALNFGSVAVGQETVIPLTASNASGTNKTPNVTLRFLGSATSGINPNDFFVEPEGCVGFGDQVEAGTACGFALLFAPTATGARSAVITITSNTGQGDYNIKVSGTGT